MQKHEKVKSYRQQHAIRPAGGRALGLPHLSPTALVWVAVAHAGLGYALLTQNSARLPSQPVPLVVRLLTYPSPSIEKLPLTPEQPKHKLPVAPQPKPHAEQAIPLPARASPVPVLASEGSSNPVATPVAPEVPSTTAHGQPLQAPPAPVSPPVQATTAPRHDAAYLENPAPSYPALSRATREEGRVVLRVYVEANGQAGKLEVQTSSGYARLDRAALAAVARWKFIPAKQGADAIAAWVLVPIAFSLKD